jgi:hypothetical protein
LALVVLAAHALVPLDSAAPREPFDRLERFRTLAGNRQATLQSGGTSRSAEDEREIYALLDEEIVQNLASGGLFASEGFLQDRLEGFAEAWGGAAFRALRVGPLAVVACVLGDGGANSVRVYGRFGGGPALLGAVRREGRPALHRLPLAPKAAPQFLVAWEGPASGRGTRELGSSWSGCAATTWRSRGAPRSRSPKG